MGFKLHINLKP
uniref:Uncharacterized protein n=1 Tax=Rhizophora mucronata TaxID=61149 RepID=A0A2P2NEX3_RHIMU